MVNGEAIYGTRTWEIFGEGPTKQEKSGMFLDKLTYTAKDIRYTKKGNTVYAIVLGWPGESAKVDLTSFTKEELGSLKIQSLSILGTDSKIDYNWDDSGLHIITPNKKVDDRANLVLFLREHSDSPVPLP